MLGVTWLSARHAATTSHAHDDAGALVHTQAIGEHHRADTTPHFHSTPGSDHDGHGGVCTLIGALPSTVEHARGATGLLCTLPVAIAPPPLVAAWTAIATYRLAPKASPPALLA